jgi:hypothetical protein
LDNDTHLAILSEGPADAKFLGKLAEVRGNFPKFYFFPHKDHHGVGGFGHMLKALKGSPRNFERLRGVLIVADSMDEPDKTFNSIKKKVKEIGGFRIPEEVLKIPEKPTNQPGVFVMLLPDEKTPGVWKVYIHGPSF